MNVTIQQCITAEGALRRWSNVRMPIKTSYHVGKLLNLVAQEVRTYAEQHDKLVKEHGAQRDPNDLEKQIGHVGPVYEVKPEQMEEFQKERKELLAMDVEISWRPLTLDQLSAAVDAEGKPWMPPPADLADLGPLVVIPEEA